MGLCLFRGAQKVSGPASRGGAKATGRSSLIAMTRINQFGFGWQNMPGFALGWIFEKGAFFLPSSRPPGRIRKNAPNLARPPIQPSALLFRWEARSSRMAGSAQTLPSTVGLFDRPPPPREEFCRWHPSAGRCRLTERSRELAPATYRRADNLLRKKRTEETAQEKQRSTALSRKGMASD